MTKISEQEFIKKLANIPLTVLLNTRFSNMFEPFSQRCQEQEFELTLDHKLGLDFSKQKRQKIKKIFLSFNRRKNSLVKEYRSGLLSGELFAKSLQALLDEQIAAYSTILSAKELEDFLAVQPYSKAVLPLDPERLD